MQTHRTFFKDRKKVPSCAGTRTKPKYSPHYDDDGVLVLDEVGIIDTYSDIQSYHDSVDMTTILRRYYNGEVDVLDRIQGFYADVSDLPKSNIEFMNRVLDSQEFFATLPTEVKEVYGNDWQRFVADFDTTNLYRSLGIVDSVPDVKESVEDVEETPVTKSTKKTRSKAPAEDAEEG